MPELTVSEIENHIFEFLSDGFYHDDLEIIIYIVLKQLEKDGEIIEINGYYQSLLPSKHSKYVKNYRKKQIEKGLCVSCTRPLVTKTRCEVHRQYHKRHNHG